jgi:hypothetical protein
MGIFLQANFYINGQLVYTGTADSVLSGQTINNSSADFTIGSHNSSADFFAGRIDEVKIWNVVRSQSDIQTDLKTWGLANASGLVAYYDFNELSSSILFNYIIIYPVFNPSLFFKILIFSTS